MRILFVHGTGVRRERFDALYALVGDRLAPLLPDAELVPVYWGDDHGAAPTRLRSLPGTQMTRGTESPDPLEQDVARWALLLADPLCELRALVAAFDADNGFGTPGVQPQGRTVADLLAGGPSSEELLDLLRSAELIDHYPDAVQLVARAEEFQDACASAQHSHDAHEVAECAARAVTARMLASVGEDALCTGDERDRAVVLLTALLGGTARVPGGRAASALGTLALRLFTQPALNHWRRPLTAGSAPAVGDILRYQARGADLRAFLHEQVMLSSEPTVLIGHSLGGIALVDLLALAAERGEPPAQVRLLVTVGSQAPFLHEIGALTGLPPGAPLPEGFPAWLNLYDRQDLLSFRASPVFPDDTRVSDHEITSRQPFPISHSTYWKLPATYELIAAAVQSAADGSEVHE
ncbi:hypothetical protein [Streptomyces sp. NPDC051576]|uniref:hypothetical protein n=1 Tax=Streptomyces sp. NPDC051576 TaxID=3155803 RepID=UPI003435C485